MSDYNGYAVDYMGTFAMFKIKNKGQGPSPKALSGYFTSRADAHKAIDLYLSKKKKGVVDGPSKGSNSS